ncbi:hypothetical protein SRHO_G00302300 [Serrasalmus rhombeus]
MDLPRLTSLSSSICMCPHGASGQLISFSWRYLQQLALLKKTAVEKALKRKRLDKARGQTRVPIGAALRLRELNGWKAMLFSCRTADHLVCSAKQQQ